MTEAWNIWLCAVAKNIMLQLQIGYDSYNIVFEIKYKLHKHTHIHTHTHTHIYIYVCMYEGY